MDSSNCPQYIVSVGKDNAENQVQILQQFILKPSSENPMYILDNSIPIFDCHSFQYKDDYIPVDKPIISSDTNPTFLSLPEDTSYMQVKKVMPKAKSQKKSDVTFTCLTCDLEFPNVACYRKHVISHQNEKKFSCDQCSTSFHIESNYKLHMTLHNESLECPLCNLTFQRTASLKSHLSSHQIEEFYTCIECFAEFEKEEYFKKHQKTHSKEKIAESKGLICSYCKVKFNNRAVLKEHLSFHLKVRKIIVNDKRSRRTRTYKEYAHKCTVCAKSFPKVSLLDRHARIHSGEKPFVCTVCNRGFNQKGTLQIHISSHIGLKPYECTLCPAKFNQKGNLKVHVQKTHMAPTSGEKIFKCTQCDCIFKKVASLNGHMSKAHSSQKDTVIDQLKLLEHMYGSSSNKQEDSGKKSSVVDAADIDKIVETVKRNISADDVFVRVAEPRTNETVKNHLFRQKQVGTVKFYSCLYCSRDFKKPSDLIRHVRTHTKEKPFECFCGAAFSLKSTLMTHLHTHNGKKTKKCLTCLKLFASSQSLRTHMRKHDTFTNGRRDLRQKAILDEQVDVDDQCSEGKGVIARPQEVLSSPPKSTGEGNGNLFKCQMCSVTFNKKRNLKRHMLLHTAEKKFECEICSKTYVTAYALKVHMRFHSAVRHFVCQTCNKGFVTRSLLKRHSITHTNVKPYLCPMCKRKFKSMAVCRRHMKTHRSDTAAEETTVIATACEANFENVPATLDVKCVPDPPRMSVVFNGGQVSILKKRNVENFTEPIIQIVGGDDVNNPQILQESTKTVQLLVAQERLDESVPLDLPLQTIYATCDDLQLADGTLCNNIYTQLKLQTGDPFVLNSLGELQEPGILFNIDATTNELYQGVDLLNSQIPFDGQFIAKEGDVATVTLDESVNTEDILEIRKKDSGVAVEPPAMNITEHFLANNLSLYPNISFAKNGDEIISTLCTEVYDEDENQQSDCAGKVDNTDAANLTTFFGCTDCVTCKKTFDSEKFGSHLCALQDPVEIDGAEFDGNEGEPVPKSTNVTVAFECDECGKCFVDDVGYAKHLEVHEAATKDAEKGDGENWTLSKNGKKAGKTIECIQCDKVFNNRSLYVKHVQVHSKNPFGLHLCKWCPKGFKKPSDLSRHFRTHTGEKPYSCKKCDKKFTLKSTLQSHYRTHDPEAKKEYNCKVCNAFFSSRASQRIHMTIHSGARPYKCTYCEEMFRTSGHKINHENKIHLSSNKPLIYKKSKKITSILAEAANDIAPLQSEDYDAVMDTNEIESSQTQVEILVNSGEKYLLGDSSDPTARFPETMQLDTSLLQQFQNSDILDVIDPSLLHSPVLQLEDGTLVMINVAKDQTSPSPSVTEEKEEAIRDSRQFECDVCHKRYASKDVLRKHKRDHAKMKFQCDKCDKRFASKESLARHSWVHSGYRPYSCFFCTNSFGEVQSLKTHLKRIHQVTDMNDPDMALLNTDDGLT